MQKALRILNEMYSKYEKNLVLDGRVGAMPHVAYQDWRTQCLEKKIYKRTDVFNNAAVRLRSRKLIVNDASFHYVYPIEIYEKYNKIDQ